MAITITLYNNNSEPERVTKSLSGARNYSGNLKEDCDIINPVVLIDGASAGVANFNYMYIPAFGRYYYITNVTAVTGALFEVHGKVDVLYTYRDQIRACMALIERQENSYNPYLQDNMLPISNDTKQFIAIFQTGKTFNKEHILLTLNAGCLKEAS